MSSEDILARRVAVIRHIVSRNGDLGKTQIQKIVYFLQESIGVPLKYRYRMHYYGPYSDELDGNLSLTESIGYIDIDPDPNGFGYHVTPVKERENTPWQGYDMSKDPEVRDLTEVINNAIDILGALETPQIELYATIQLLQRENGADRQETEDKVFYRTYRLLVPETQECQPDLSSTDSWFHRASAYSQRAPFDGMIKFS
ncbi:MAG: hypothetical protein J4G14_05090 [Dehalococcoidia bacterium]|nr:hypothetical protein [Dehalococcoidia bacterium]